MISFREYLDEGADAALKKKAEASGVSLSTLKTVYKRGVAAWNSGHRPGTTPQQWGMARVNSYITKGKGTYGGADKDLREEHLVFALEEAVDAIDQGEYDYEGAMTKTQLQTILRSAEELIEVLKDDENMPEWVQAKITKAEDYISSVRDYLMSRRDLGESLEEDARIDKKAYHRGVSDSTAKARVAHWKKMDKLSDKDPRAYEPAPGDATAKTKESKHTKKYRELYGDKG